MRKSDTFLTFIALCAALMLVAFLHSQVAKESAAKSVELRARMVRHLELTDLCLFTEARYTRHPSQADRHTAFRTTRCLSNTSRPAPSWGRRPSCGEGISMGRIDKQKNILDFTLSSLLRRKGRNLSLALVYTLIVFTLGSVVLFTQAMKKEASIILRDTPEIVIQKMVAGRHDLIPVSYIDKIVSIRGVGSASARLWDTISIPRAGPTIPLSSRRTWRSLPGK